jgi:hypothetical protein
MVSYRNAIVDRNLALSLPVVDIAVGHTHGCVRMAAVTRGRNNRPHSAAFSGRGRTPVILEDQRSGEVGISRTRRPARQHRLQTFLL